MEAPDKIFVPTRFRLIDGLQVRENDTDEEYIRKNAILEWAKDVKDELENHNGIKEDVRNGAVWELEEIIAKIESL